MNEMKCLLLICCQPCSTCLHLVFDSLQSRCAKNGARGWEDWYLLNQIMGIVSFHFARHSCRLLVLPSFVWILGVLSLRRLKERGKPGDNNFALHLPFCLPHPCFLFLLQLGPFVVHCWCQASTSRDCCKQMNCCMCLREGETEEERNFCWSWQYWPEDQGVSLSLSLSLTHNTVPNYPLDHLLLLLCWCMCILAVDWEACKSQILPPLRWNYIDASLCP